jgi:hypothetical protein
MFFVVGFFLFADVTLSIFTAGQAEKNQYLTAVGIEPTSFGLLYNPTHNQLSCEIT